MASSCVGEVQVGNEETFLLRKSGQALGRAAQGGGGVTVLGVFKERSDVGLGDVVWGVTLVGGGQLDQMILEAFSNPNDSTEFKKHSNNAQAHG